MSLDQKTGLPPPTPMPDKPEREYQALVDQAMREQDTPAMAVYLELAEKAGYSPHRIYSLATTGYGMPTHYEDFQSVVEGYWEGEARRQARQRK
jgi:hypothetical protein